MKKIILPTDFSDNAYKAICYALKLYSKEECTFYLLNTYTPAIYQSEYILHSPGQIGLGDIYQSHSVEQLEALKKELELKFKNPKHTFIIHSVFNLLVDEVVDLANKEEADMIIMGTQGATGAKEIFIGSHTVHVIKKAPCPVLAVPAGYNFEDPIEILFPTDFEINYQQAQLTALLDLTAHYNSKIDIIHISSGNELTPKQLKNKDTLHHLMGERKPSFP